MAPLDSLGPPYWREPCFVVPRSCLRIHHIGIQRGKQLCVDVAKLVVFECTIDVFMKTGHDMFLTLLFDHLF